MSCGSPGAPRSEASSLIRELFDPRRAGWKPGRREQIVAALVAIGPPAVPELVEKLGDWSSSGGLTTSLTFGAACCVIRALGEIGDHRAWKVLTQVGTRHPATLSQLVAEALAQLGDRNAIPYLLSLLNPDESVPFEARLTALFAFAVLADLGDLELISRGLWVLADEQEGANWELRQQACAAVADRLLSFRTAAALPALLVRPVSQHVTPQALAEIGVEGIPALVYALDPDAHFQSMSFNVPLALQSLIELGAPAVPVLRHYMRSATPQAGSRCAILLCHLGAGDDELIAPVVLALDRLWWLGAAVTAFARLAAQSQNPTLRSGLVPLRRLAANLRVNSVGRAQCRRLARRVLAMDLRTALRALGPFAPTIDAMAGRVGARRVLGIHAREVRDVANA